MADEAVTVDRLAEWHLALITDLTGVLDLDIGLREAMVPGRHRDLVAGLDDLLDLTGGLAAIMGPTSAVISDPDSGPIVGRPGGQPADQDPGSARKHQPGTAQPIDGSGPVSTVEAFVQAIEALPDGARLMVRSRVRTSVMYLAASHDLVACLDRAQAHVAAINRRGPDLVVSLPATLKDIDELRAALRHGLYLIAQLPAIALVLAEAVNSLSEFVERANTVPDNAVSIATKLTQARTEARQLVTDLARTVATAFSRALKRARISPPDSVELAKGDHLVALRRLVDDFVGADLHRADLGRAVLDGVRWSADTRWPPNWESWIEQNSRPIGAGVHEIQPGTGTIEGNIALTQHES